MNIVLTGFMGTGKTSVGKLLAKKLKFKYVDTDEIIEKKAKMKITGIFAKLGEPRFRDIETDAVAQASRYDSYVIATGGGVVLREKNMELLRKDGLIINLNANPRTIYGRTKASKARPLLNKPGPENEIRKLLELREPFYRNNDLRIDTDNLTIEQVVNKCLDYIVKKP